MFLKAQYGLAVLALLILAASSLAPIACAQTAGLTSKESFQQSVASRGPIDHSRYPKCPDLGAPAAGSMKDGVRYTWCYMQPAEALWFEAWADGYTSVAGSGGQNSVVSGDGLHATILIYDAGSRTCGSGACQNPPQSPECIQFLANQYDVNELPSKIIDNALQSLDDGGGEAWWPTLWTGKVEVTGYKQATFHGQLLQTAGKTNIQISFEWGREDCSANSVLVGTTSEAGSFSKTMLNVFLPNTQYKYRIRGHISPSTWIYGETRTFTTGAEGSTQIVVHNDLSPPSPGTTSGNGTTPINNGTTPNGGTVTPTADLYREILENDYGVSTNGKTDEQVKKLLNEEMLKKGVQTQDGWIGKCLGSLTTIFGSQEGCSCFDERRCKSSVIGLWCGGSGRTCAPGFSCFGKESNLSGVQAGTHYGCWIKEGFQNCEQAFADYGSLIMVYDTNGDGSLSESETDKAMEEWQDGGIAASEYAILEQYSSNGCNAGSQAPDCKEVSQQNSELSKYDTNGDKKIDQSEYDSASNLWKSTRIPESDSFECYDSDEGYQEAWVPGYCRDKDGNIFQDECVNGGKVKEWHCGKDGECFSENWISDEWMRSLSGVIPALIEWGHEWRCNDGAISHKNCYSKCQEKGYATAYCAAGSSSAYESDNRECMAGWDAIDKCTGTERGSGSDCCCFKSEFNVIDPPTDEIMGLLARAKALGCNIQTGEGGPSPNPPGNGTVTPPGGGGDKPPGGGGCGGDDPQGSSDRYQRSCQISPRRAETSLGCGAEVNFTVALTRFNETVTPTIECGDGDPVDVECTTTSCTFKCRFDQNGTYGVGANMDGVECGTATVVVKPRGRPPIADFGWNPSRPLTGANITLDANYSWDQDGEGISKYIWDFDSDGVNDLESTSRSVIHTFVRGGRHNVTLTVEDRECLRNSTSKPIDVGIPINIRLVSATDEGRGKRVCFAVDIPSDSQVTYLEMDFGDGTVTRWESMQAELCHFYMPGDYDVKATVMLSDGSFSTAEYGLNVELGLCPPIPNFDFYPEVPGIGDIVYFDASGSVDLDGGNVEEYAWDFGDGQTETSSTPSIDHIYTMSGSYVVRLTVTDDENQVNSMTALLVVAARQIDLIVTSITPREHSSDVVFGMHIPSGAELQRLELDFGDNSQHLTLNQFQGSSNHSYIRSGTYIAIMRVTFLDGQVGEDRETITAALLSEGVWVNATIRKQGYKAGETLGGQVGVRYRRPLPTSSVMRALISGDQKDEKSLSTYLTQPGVTNYKQNRFTYQIKAVGDTRQLNTSSINFSYTTTANGTCGGSFCSGDGCDCTCSPPYPCRWNAQYQGTGSVSTVAGLKLIYNVESSITPPADGNADTTWNVNDNSQDVVTTMRMACGAEPYAGLQTDANGWIRRTLTATELTGVPGTSDRQASIEKFDGASLFPPRIFGNQGGIYKNGVYQTYDVGARWDGNANGHGYVRIINYDSSATYEIAYLSPVGPRLCAYTTASISNAQTWEKTATEEHLVRYGTPFTKTYTEAELATLLALPTCGSSCQVTVHSYTITKTADTDYNVMVTSFRNISQSTLTVAATAISPMFDQDQQFSVDFSTFQNLVAPQQLGNHTITFRIVDGGSALSSGSAYFVTCADADGDGYCAGSGLGMDCNDMDPDSKPGTTERCDGVDNDCDGAVDEDFWTRAGSKLGQNCGIGECSGYYVCGTGGSETCNGKIQGSKEVCDNFLDDDCDGLTDEAECSCPEGQRMACGEDRGDCKAGTKICEFGSWSVCRGEVKGTTEVCNRKDDDCDGVIDNLAGENSVEETRCTCFRGAPPKVEVCDGLDDDCDGRIDEGLTCCEEGDSRSCTDQLGICAEGYQECIDGFWGDCSIKAQEEVCWNDLDDDCDGEVDDYDICYDVPKPSTNDGPWMWYVIAGLVIAVAAGAGILYLTGRL